jgi:hypothetical protein
VVAEAFCKSKPRSQNQPDTRYRQASTEEFKARWNITADSA